jgi:adenosylcobyric acid synthase
MVAVCGGAQILGDRIDDPHGVEGPAQGLGLVPATTVLGPDKLVRRTSARFASGLGAPWASLAGQQVDGYEIRFGRTDFRAPATAALPDGLGFACGNILAVYLHGLAEAPGVVEALTGGRPANSIDDVCNGLADLVDQTIDMGRVLAWSES